MQPTAWPPTSTSTPRRLEENFFDKCRQSSDSKGPSLDAETWLRTLGMHLAANNDPNDSSPISGLCLPNPRLLACGGSRRLLLVAPDGSVTPQTQEHLARYFGCTPTIVARQSRNRLVLRGRTSRCRPSCGLARRPASRLRPYGRASPYADRHSLDGTTYRPLTDTGSPLIEVTVRGAIVILSAAKISLAVCSHPRSFAALRMTSTLPACERLRRTRLLKKANFCEQPAL